MRDQMNNNRSAAPLVFLGVILVVGMCIAMWHLRHEAIAQNLLRWKAYEILPFSKAMSLFGSELELKQKLYVYYRYAKYLTFKEVWLIGTQIGWLFAPFPIGLAVWTAYKVMKNPILRAKQVHTVQTLLESQSGHFSAVAPILKRDLTDDKSPEWASSMHPEEWVAEYGLIVNEQLDEDRTRQLFEGQLGKRIRSVKDMSKVEKALFAVFAIRVFERDLKRAQKLIDALNYSASNERSRPDLSVADAEFKLMSRNKGVRKWLMKHPYPRTLLMAMLIEGREVGTLPSSNFIWLKPTERALWYPLNTAGRKTPFVESAAVFTQMQAEQVAWDNDCVLEKPHVDEAVKALRIYLEDREILVPRAVE